MRALFKGSDPAPGAKHLEGNLKIYPLSKAGDPPATDFIDVSTKSYNTVPPNDFSFYEQLNELIQQEPIESLLCSAADFGT